MLTHLIGRGNAEEKAPYEGVGLPNEKSMTVAGFLENCHRRNGVAVAEEALVEAA